MPTCDKVSIPTKVASTNTGTIRKKAADREVRQITLISHAVSMNTVAAENDESDNPRIEFSVPLKHPDQEMSGPGNRLDATRTSYRIGPERDVREEQYLKGENCSKHVDPLGSASD